MMVSFVKKIIKLGDSYGIVVPVKLVNNRVSDYVKVTFEFVDFNSEAKDETPKSE